MANGGTIGPRFHNDHSVNAPTALQVDVLLRETERVTPLEIVSSFGHGSDRHRSCR